MKAAERLVSPPPSRQFYRQSVTSFDHQMQCHRSGIDDTKGSYRKMSNIKSNNNSGAFERAKDQWNCAVIHLTGDLGRGGLNVGRVGNMMAMHANRKEFYEHNELVAFPSLARLAFMLHLNEKTVRRARNKLVELGLISVAHRYNNSNYYFLRIPAAARKHAEVCIDLLTSPRHRIASASAPDHDVNVQLCPDDDDAQMSGGVDNYAPNHDVNVQLP
jgi:hypothetical protein